LGAWSLQNDAAQPAGATSFYVPKAKSFVHDSVTKNYSLNYSAAVPTTEVLFNMANTRAGGCCSVVPVDDCQLCPGDVVRAAAG
jgi:hypothetical protein